MPAQAAQAFDGYAYLVAGAEPGNVCGVALPDPADVENALDGFIAHGHPLWRLHRVEVDGAVAAVVEVSPPRSGDRICCLQRTFDSAAAGRIFVRRQGQTREAAPDAVRALEDRYAAVAVELQHETNALTKQRLTLDERRDTQDQLDRAERTAPRFASGRIGDGFAHNPPNELLGIVRNVGGSAATIKDTRLMPELGGSYPGAAIPVYGQGPSGEFGLPVRIDKGAHAQLRYRHDNLEALARSSGPLSAPLHK